jgi:cell division GTPase FtsZ
LINVTASPDVTLQEVNEAAELIHAEADDDANIIWGMVIDPDLEDRVKVTVIATGFGDRSTRGLSMSGVGGSTSGFSAQRTAMRPVAPQAAAVGTLQQQGSTPVKPASNAANEGAGRRFPGVSSSEDDKYEIPTFLRKQAD